LLYFNHEYTFAKRVGKAAGDEECVAGVGGDFLEATFHGGDVLLLDHAAEFGGLGRVLETHVEIRVGDAVAHAEDVVGLGLAGGGAEAGAGELARGVALEVEADGGVEELDQEHRVDAVAGDVGGAEEVVGVGVDERAEVVGLAADEDLGNAFVDVFASGYPGTGDGADPVLGEVGVAGLRRASELVEGFASGVGAPDAVGREEDEFALVMHGDALEKGSGRQTTALSPPSMVRSWPLT